MNPEKNLEELTKNFPNVLGIEFNF